MGGVGVTVRLCLALAVMGALFVAFVQSEYDFEVQEQYYDDDDNPSKVQFHDDDDKLISNDNNPSVPIRDGSDKNNPTAPTRDDRRDFGDRDDDDDDDDEQDDDDPTDSVDVGGGEPSKDNELPTSTKKPSRQGSASPLADHLRFVPFLVALGLLLLYCVAMRVAYSVDYCHMKQGSVVTLENYKCDGADSEKQHIYMIVVDTGKWVNSGTTAHARIEFHAKSFCSKVYCLKSDHFCRKILRQCHRDIFVVKTSDCLGDVLSLTLLLITSGHNTSWFLEQIKLVDITHNNSWTFSCYRWLKLLNKPSMIIKLFPNKPSYHRKYMQVIESRFVELHLWFSVFTHYNRLGRVNRLERITLCFNMAMTFLFVFVVCLNYFNLVPQKDEENYDEKLAEFVLLSLCIVLAVSMFCLIIELILRNSVPWGWKFYNMARQLDFKACHECQPCGVPFAGDMALLPDENPCTSPVHNTLQCQVCLDTVHEKMQLASRSVSPLQSPMVTPFLNESQRSQPTPKSSLTTPKHHREDPMKYYELADKYVDFFTGWNAFTNRYIKLLEELKEFLNHQGEVTCTVRHFRTLTWMLSAMRDLQDAHCMKRLQNFTAQCQLTCPLPSSLLLPLTGVGMNANRIANLSDQSKNVLRLIRAMAVVILVMVCDNVHCFKMVCTNTYTELDSELVASLHHTVSTLLNALHAFILHEDQLCKVLDGTVLAHIDGIQEFLKDYLESTTLTDYDIVDSATLNCHLKGVLKDRKLNVCEIRRLPAQEVKYNAAIKSKLVIKDFTKRIVTDIVKDVVAVMEMRRPLNTFYDFMQYKSSTQESQEWAVVCMEYMMPLVNSITCPLVKHCHQFLCLRASTNLMVLADHYIETLITNAALQAAQQNAARDELHCGSWLTPITKAQCEEIIREDQPQADYDLLLQRLKDCILRNNVPSLDSAFCTEGKIHIQDKHILQLLLEEGRLKSNQLAYPGMIHMMIAIIQGSYKKLTSIQQFITQAVLMLTQSQESWVEKDDCLVDDGDRFVRTFRQHLLDLSFLVARLVRKSEEVQVVAKPGRAALPPAEPPAYWSMPGYHQLKFVEMVATYKMDLISPVVPPLCRQEHDYIQGVAFRIHKKKLAQRWTMALYFYLTLQNVIFLAAILYWTKHWKNSVTMGCLICLAGGICLDIFILQPIKVFLAVLYIRLRKQQAVQNTEKTKTKAEKCKDNEKTSEDDDMRVFE